MRLAAAATSGGLIAFATWLVLGLLLGNVGLQRSIAVGPATLAEQPLALLAVGVTSAVGGTLTARRIRLGIDGTAAMVFGLLLADVVAAILIAPSLVGEITLAQAPSVFLVLVAFGIQPVAATIGAAWLAAQRPAEERFLAAYARLLDDLGHAAADRQTRRISDQDFVADLERLVARIVQLGAPRGDCSKLKDETLIHLGAQLRRYQTTLAGMPASQEELEKGEAELGHLLATYERIRLPESH